MHSSNVRIFVEVSGISFFMNWAWEYAQCSVFIHLSVPATHSGMLLASMGDVLLTWLSVGLVALGTRSLFWFLGQWKCSHVRAMIFINLALATSIERIALRWGRWAYTVSNPVIPGLNVSLLPLLQLSLLIPLTLWLVRRRIVQRGSIRSRQG